MLGIFLNRHTPEEFAQEGEEFLTNFTIRPDIQANCKAKAQRYLQGYYPDYDLRFAYENLVISGRVVTSEQFGYETSGLPEGQAFGVAVYGRRLEEEA